MFYIMRLLLVLSCAKTGHCLWLGLHTFCLIVDFIIKLSSVELLVFNIMFNIMFMTTSRLTQVHKNCKLEKQNNKQIIIKITKSERIKTELQLRSENEK